jgi:tetratricopeptide (TPR) repeat protein
MPPRADDPVVNGELEDSSALVDMALSHPEECRDQLRALLKTQHSRNASSAIWQALAIAERELGNIDTARRYLRRAIRMADASESPNRRADVRATLAVTLSLLGRSTIALDLFDSAAQLATGLTAARVEMRRATALWDAGRNDQALKALHRCVPVLRRNGDDLWEARALLTRAAIQADGGAPGRANTSLERALVLFRRNGQHLEVARAWHDLGWAAYRSGHVVRALELLARAADAYRAASVREPAVAIDQSRVLRAAGLFADAERHALEALEHAYKINESPGMRASAELTVAEAALAGGRAEMAMSHATRATRLYRVSGNTWGEMRGRLVALQSRWIIHHEAGRVLADVIQLADHLAKTSTAENASANLLAGRIALTIGHTEAAARRLGSAAQQRRRGAPLDRVTGWLAKALLAESIGPKNAIQPAVRAGWRILEEYRLSLGATELRAAGTTLGTELAEIALRYTKQNAGPRDLLASTERWRATTLALPPVRPPDDRALAADLAKLRDVTHRLAEARTAGTSTAPLERERRRLEEAIRARTLQTPGQKESGDQRFEVSRLLDSLGEGRLVSIVEVDGELTVLVAAARRVRMFSAGRLEEAAREVDYARFALRGAAGTGVSRAEVALRRLETGGPRLQEMLFGDAVRALGDGPLIVVPPARLHATPWGVLPALRNRPFAVAPSAASWLRAVTRRAPRRRDVVLVAGPNLGSRGAEVTTLRRTYEDAQVLANGAATCEDALTALNGAWLAHVAAHGVLRADNPLFSALTLADGPLTVYDLERLRRAPYRLILSACESGIGTTAGADEVLGLASAVISLGTAGLLGSTVIVDDDAAVQVSLIVHEHLRAGADLAHALYCVRQATVGDPVAHATSLAFLALGAA